jgi:hypothetical protein
MQSAHLLPASLPLPTALATASQRQALRELASKVHPIHRSGVVAGLDTLTYQQAARRVGHHYLLATGQLGDFTRAYVVPDNQAGPGLPQGSLVLLRTVGADSLNVGDWAMCTDKDGSYKLLGRVCRARRGKFPPDLRLTLAQAGAEHTLWARRPNVYWYRVDVISLAC